MNKKYLPDTKNNEATKVFPISLILIIHFVYFGYLLNTTSLLMFIRSLVYTLKSRMRDESNNNEGKHQLR